MLAIGSLDDDGPNLSSTGPLTMVVWFVDWWLLLLLLFVLVESTRANWLARLVAIPHRTTIVVVVAVAVLVVLRMSWWWWWWSWSSSWK